MKSTIFYFINIILFFTLFVSCQKDEDIKPNSINYLKIAEALSDGSSFTVEMYAKDSLFVGYNKVYYKVTDTSTGLKLSQATLLLKPLMDMTTFFHACPFENPEVNVNADNYFEGAIVFSMPGSNNSWSLSVDVTAAGKTETANLAIDKVIGTTPVQKIVVMDSVITAGVLTVTKFPISIVKPATWKVGMNTFEITINMMQSMMMFPICEDFTVEITPEMPSMGHGSPNNVNPVYIGNGHYLGSVNFTMTGDWRINMSIKKSNWIKARKAYFDILF
jgi:hypothetical protein